MFVSINRKFLKLASQVPAVGASGIPRALEASVTFDYAIPGLTMSQFFTIRRDNCQGPIVSVGEPTASNANRTFTYSLAGLDEFSTYVTCVSQLLYDTQGLYLANAIANSWQTGPIYFFTQWAPSATPGLYPIKMTFRCSSTMDPNLSASITADYTGHTDVGVTSFGVRGENANGISVLNTGTANANCGNGFLAAIDISIDTSNRTNIQVSWKAAQISDQTREYGLRLQHNCGGGGSFTDVPGHEFSSVTAGTSTSYFSYGPTTLPALCNNKANAVLRWRYYYISGSGNRTRIALDDVEVTGTP